MSMMRNSGSIATLALVALFSLPLAGVSEARQQASSTSTGKAFAKRSTDATGIPRFAEIGPGFMRGGQPSESDYKYLHDRGTKTIVSFLADNEESSMVTRLGMKYVHIPIHSGPFSCDTPTDAEVRQFLAITQDSTQFPLFMHCKAGKDRTGAMTAIYRMEAQGWTRDEALEEMKSFGFAGHFHKLYNYVHDYTPHPIPAPPLTAPTTASTGASTPNDAPGQEATIH